MALTKAVAAGAVAALALPWAFRGSSSTLAQWVHRGIVDFEVLGVHLTWSWLIFCVVTLFAWGLIAWAERS